MDDPKLNPPAAGAAAGVPVVDPKENAILDRCPNLLMDGSEQIHKFKNVCNARYDTKLHNEQKYAPLIRREYFEIDSNHQPNITTNRHYKEYRHDNIVYIQNLIYTSF